MQCCTAWKRVQLVSFLWNYRVNYIFRLNLKEKTVLEPEQKMLIWADPVSKADYNSCKEKVVALENAYDCKIRLTRIFPSGTRAILETPPFPPPGGRGCLQILRKFWILRALLSSLNFFLASEVRVPKQLKQRSPPIVGNNVSSNLILPCLSRQDPLEILSVTEDWQARPHMRGGQLRHGHHALQDNEIRFCINVCNMQSWALNH